MQIHRKRAIDFLHALQFKSVKRWDDKRIIETLMRVVREEPRDFIENNYPEFLHEYDVISEIEFPDDLALVGPRTSWRKYQRKDRPPPMPRDDLNSRQGTIAFKVNQNLSDEWKSDVELARESGMDLKRARAHLYHMAKTGKVEHRRIIQFRISPKYKRQTDSNR